jgi:hypothetical protein
MAYTCVDPRSPQEGLGYLLWGALSGRGKRWENTQIFAPHLGHEAHKSLEDSSNHEQNTHIEVLVLLIRTQIETSVGALYHSSFWKRRGALKAHPKRVMASVHLMRV